MTDIAANPGTVGLLGKGYQYSVNNAPERPLLVDPSGAAVIMDFYLKAVLDGRVYQVKAGTITTPLIGTAPLTDTSAEFCIDPQASYTAIPVCQIISVRLGAGTLHEFATKSVAGASSSGAAFTPLPLLHTSPNCTTTARVAATAGTVTVAAELATTTRRHWSFSQAIAMGAYDAHCVWEPRMPPGIRSSSNALKCLYTQVSATTTGDSYYANLDFMEFLSAQLGL